MKTLLPVLAALVFTAPLHAQSAPSFEELDADGNDSLSQEEVRIAGVSEEHFKKYDTDGDGEWSKEEFKVVTGQAPAN